jgi:hypothetical protein
MPSKRSKRSPGLDSTAAALGAEEWQGNNRTDDGERDERASGEDQGMKVSSRMGEEVNRLIENQIGRGNETLKAVAHAIDATADQLRDQSPRLAEMAKAVSQRVDDLAGRVEKRSPSELLEEAANFGRRRPVAFFAGAVAAGFLVSRFIKSSASRQGAASESEPIAGDARHAGP